MQQERSSGIPWAILGSALMLSFSSGVRNFCIPPLERIIREELLLTYTQTGLLFTVPIIMMVALSLPAGILVDRIGVRRATGIGAILMAVGTVLRGIADDYHSLLIFTIILGAGGGFLLPNLAKLVSLWIPRERVGIATGMYFSATTAGGAITLAITLPLIFPITNTIQGTFLILSIPTIIAAIMWWALVKDPSHGTIPDETLRESRVPLKQILGNKTLLIISIFFFITSFFFHSWAAWTPELMIQKGASANTASLIASTLMWVTVPAILITPRLAHRLGLRKPFLWIPSIILAFTPLWAIYITVPMGWPLIMTVGIFDSVRTIITLAIPIEIMPKEAVGTASGLIVTIGFSGGIIGPIVVGYILDLTGSIDLSLLILIGISVTAIGLAFRIPETGPKAGHRVI
ncbi:CynX/NimT family MFS transporter [Chloroflexota bacterium]